MRGNSNFTPNRALLAGLCLNAVYLGTAHLLKFQAPLFSFFQGLLAGAAIALMVLGVLRATSKGRALLPRAERPKGRLLGRAP